MGRRFTVFIAACVAVAIVLVPEIALARAGGGGGGGGGGGRFALFAWPMMLLYSGAVTLLIGRKQREAKALLDRIEHLDPLWSEDHIRKRVEATYFAVQEAWTQRDQDLAREFMSDRLYEKHKKQTDSMLRDGRRNVLENVNLIHSKIIGVRDFADDSKDRFQVHIKGSMVDYHIKVKSGTVVSGDAHTTGAFEEVWHFVRGETDWVLDEIEQDAGLIDVVSAGCSSQSIDASA